jgi:hypothetical protein
MKYMRITTGYTWTDYKTNAQIANELKITPILDKLLEYKTNWIQYVNRVPRNTYITKGNDALYPSWQKESHKTFEETFGYVRPERVNKWPNSVTDMMMMMMMMMMMATTT